MNYSKPGSTGMQMDASMDVSMDVSMDPNGSKTPCYGTWKRERERDRGRILENGRECHIICHFIWETIWSATSLIKYILHAVNHSCGESPAISDLHRNSKLLKGPFLTVLGMQSSCLMSKHFAIPGSIWQHSAKQSKQQFMRPNVGKNNVTNHP